MPQGQSPMDGMVRKLSTRAPLDDADRAAILALPHALRRHHANTYMMREGEPARTQCIFLSSGFAYRQKLTVEGARQIVSLHLPGDFIDLQNLFLSISDHNVQALTEVEVIGVDGEALREVALRRPQIGKAMWIDTLVDASIFREWVLNVGRRDARARVAHVLCEFAIRAKAAGIGTEEGFELPMTQEQLGDAVGLTSVHVNRTLKALAAEGVINRSKREIGFSSWSKVSRIADFSALYLHLDQVRPS